MRVLQLIDSLRPGGAERMAVNYANALEKCIDVSYLCCTRKEGLLKNKISSKVGYFFLDRQSTLDLKAILGLREIVKENKIDLIQAHGNSWFIAILIKITLPNVKLVWHDHWGERALRNHPAGALKIGSLFFNAVITVNSSLKDWARKNLITKNIIAIENFVPKEKVEDLDDIQLKGNKPFKIVYLANLKYPKDHFTLLEALKSIKSFKPAASLHFIGKDENDYYSKRIKKYINDHDLQENVFIYGERENIAALLKQAHLGVLTSVSEGLPLALLEYGSAGLPVVSTKVGACPEVIGETGILVPALEPISLASGIEKYLNNKKLRENDGGKFKQRVEEIFSEEIIVRKVFELFETIVNKNFHKCSKEEGNGKEH